jgi:hypothetical protein
LILHDLCNRFINGFRLYLDKINALAILSAEYEHKYQFLSLMYLADDCDSLPDVSSTGSITLY